MIITRVPLSQERALRRRLAQTDLGLAMHTQLRDYFLADTEMFGVLATENMQDLCFYSIYNGVFYVHQIVGTQAGVNQFVQYVTDRYTQAQMFLTPPQHMDISWTGSWKEVLSVWPGMVVEHRAYDGVFARGVPRFEGVVWELGTW